MPSHGHNFGVGGGGPNLNSLGRGTNQGWSCHTCSFNQRTDLTGGGQPHNNMPPFYVLAYIMKL